MKEKQLGICLAVLLLCSACQTVSGDTSARPYGRSYAEPTTGMEFVWVEGGCFQLGDSFGDGKSNEKPVHEVCVDSFYIGKYEVTEGQWRKIMGDGPALVPPYDRYPVDRVSWYDVQGLIAKLNSNGGKFRLPTEAEWEYAARSGGKKEKYAGGADVDRVAWYRKNSENDKHVVGTKSPNGLGIYDMSGNVWEWCQDRFDENYYKESPRDNPQVSSSGAARLLRGGSYYFPAAFARATARVGYHPASRNRTLGLRLVLPVPPVTVSSAAAGR